MFFLPLRVLLFALVACCCLGSGPSPDQEAIPARRATRNWGHVFEIGGKVTLVGDLPKPELTGMAAVVNDFDSATGLYSVSLLCPYPDCTKAGMSLPPTNLIRMASRRAHAIRQGLRGLQGKRARYAAKMSGAQPKVVAVQSGEGRGDGREEQQEAVAGEQKALKREEKGKGGEQEEFKLQRKNKGGKETWAGIASNARIATQRVKGEHDVGHKHNSNPCCTVSR